MSAIEISILLVAVALFSILLIPFALLGVPPMPALPRERQRVVKLLDGCALPANARIYELGSGWGDLALALARAFPKAQVVGIELSPLPFLVSWVRTWGKRNLKVRWGNYFNADLTDADALTAYLMIKPMPRLAGLLDEQLKDGTPVVALSFSFRDRQNMDESQGNALSGKAWLYRWPAR